MHACQVCERWFGLRSEGEGNLKMNVDVYLKR
jgi:hypothetical protein